MVADFVSAEYGWLASPDGTETARWIFKAGKNRDGWFTHVEIIEHVQRAMSILDKHYPHERHVFVFDNATTHLKRAEDALSARRMPKNPTRPGKPVFGVERIKRDDNGNPVHDHHSGAVIKERARMQDGQFANGRPQSLYFPPDHPQAGAFKGMAIILKERGFAHAPQLRAECPGCKCPKDQDQCCCRRLLYSQPDFAGTTSLLEAACKARGYNTIFLPKFHCELNFIEMCWGYAKRQYRLLPPSSSEAEMEQNVRRVLDSIPIETIRRFSTRSRRFMDAYRKGLNGKQAMWAAKKYHGHRVLPDSIMEELDTAGI
ncbi:hypothetical protein PUNSTDRAFT_114017 [Punctularia strigosozonata HHB-11173 SS5]|uniref:uncharacterized protein n=1 Tax=Punctularia strigosozonata (strain HHB-11173) TaxID=741275 RepID=UPI000441862F|nr:uncharacterized protein PUNSTDRAFT_114017 [Punctularia strigosozonata HHB-11173 SS5]EIN08526.1 hypothetical protein PUNSTDRAFT_114017 [Punctularia strigosozonata HHB-11173 SS5]